jgi:P-type Mg2+ transporter
LALTLENAATLDVERVVEALGTRASGLSSDEAERRLTEFGRNELPNRGTGALAVLLRQLTNPFLVLLASTAVLSLILRDSSDAVIILFIVVLSVGLSFTNEYRSERAVEDLRARVQPKVVVMRDGHRMEIDAALLTPGDVVLLEVGDIVPADLRLIDVRALECDESALTGEAIPEAKSSAPSSGEGTATRSCVAYSGSIVKNGTATGVVVATGLEAQFGSIARQLARRPPQTAFEAGLRDFSLLLVRVTVVLTSTIFVVNALLHHPLLESLLFALAIAIGLTPQLLPAIVTVSLSFGARVLAKRGVIVKRLVSIEDLGNVEVLFTDKTGTLTEGRLRFRNAIDPAGAISSQGVVLGIVCSEVVVENGRVVRGNALDVALWEGASDQCRAAASRYHVVDRVPFSYDRQMSSVLVDAPDGKRLIVSKGAPEKIVARCTDASDRMLELLAHEFEAGSRVIAIASRETTATVQSISGSDERDLHADALLLFADEPKADAKESLEELERLNIALKIVTGDNDRVAQSICRQLGIPITGVLTGSQLSTLSDEQLAAALPATNIFARVTPDQKSRIIRLARAAGTDVGFLGDGVNDAVALHDADVGISVDSAVDVAKDAADIVLLEKDLSVLAAGVMEGRRIFANTIKYVLMGTSSNFGNMFSAAGASLFLTFLPMLPSQILLNNLLYDVSEMAIPTDNVDEEQLQRPARWDPAFIRRFMMFFGPISSVFDFATFGVMLFVLHATHALFRTGWFVESLSTQSLVIFLIRTRRVPFIRSKPSAPLTVTTLGVAALGAILPFTGVGKFLGFAPLPPVFFPILAAMIAAYLGLIELGKAAFFRKKFEPPATNRSASPKSSAALR